MLNREIDFFSWPIREPVKRRPFSGAFIGAMMGLAFGGLANPGDFVVGRDSIVAGFALGGAAAGLIIGALLPWFRSRVVAGLVVSVAMSVAFLIMHRMWQDFLPPAMSIFLGFSTGFAYAVLFWKYEDGGQEPSG